MPRAWEEKKRIVEQTFESDSACEVRVDGRKAFDHKVSSPSPGSSSFSVNPQALEEKGLIERFVRADPKYWWLAGLLPRTTETLMLKELGYHFKLWNIRVLIPAGTTVVALFKVPPLEIWWLWSDVHDFPVETFIHEHLSDGRPIYPPVLVCGHNMSIKFNIPFYTLEYATCMGQNVTDGDVWFSQTIERTIEPRWIFDKRRELLRKVVLG